MNRNDFRLPMLLSLFLAVIMVAALSGSETTERIKAEELYRKGVTAYLSGDYADAVSALSNAIAADSSLAIAYNAAGMAYLKLHNWRSAEEILREATRRDSSYAFAYYNLAEALYNNPRGDADAIRESIRDLRRAIDLEKDPSQLLNAKIKLGYYLSSCGEVEAAAREFAQAVAIDSTSLTARMGLIGTLRDSSLIYEQISRILDFDSAYMPALITLADVAFINNQYLKAINIYRRIVGAGPARCRNFRTLIQMIDFYCGTVDYWRDHYFIEGKKKNASLLAPWYGYRKQATLERDQAVRFDRKGREYRKIYGFCRDSIAVPETISQYLKACREMIRIREDSTSCFRMAQFLDALGRVVGALRSEIVAKAKETIPDCPLPGSPGTTSPPSGKQVCDGNQPISQFPPRR